jgi:hypothetical protein
MASNSGWSEDISNNLSDIRRVLQGILEEMRRRNSREESILQAKIERDGILTPKERV